MPLTNRKRRAQNKALYGKNKESKDKLKDATNDGAVPRKASQHKYNEAHKEEKKILNHQYNAANTNEKKAYNKQYTKANTKYK